jgi:hypothetical protein
MLAAATLSLGGCGPIIEHERIETLRYTPAQLQRQQRAPAPSMLMDPQDRSGGGAGGGGGGGGGH